VKYRLLAPGPTPVPERVLTAMANPIVHHRTPAFEATFAECRAGLQWLFQTSYDVLTLASSGTGAMEAAFRSLMSPGEKVITIGGGKFGNRWGEMATALGLDDVHIDVEWGQAVELSKVEEALREHADARAVVVVASETSTGVRHPYEEIGKLVERQDDCLLFVDGITAVGVWDIKPERDRIDVLVSGSQKALMLPPGIGFACVSDKAWERADKAKGLPGYYFDLKKEKKALAKNQTAYTPAVTLITGLREALAILKEEGLEHIFQRHARLARATRAGVGALGLEVFAKSPADSVTSVVSPAELGANGVYTGLRDRANITIAGGQDHLKGKIFRVAHLGYYDELDMVTLFGALEVVLHKGGWDRFEYGAGVGAALAVLQEGFELQV
jgi:aspartate aminotransferase-like enzyme